MASLKSLRSFNLNLNPILQNRLVLYFLLFIAIVDLFYSLQTSDFTAIFIFLIVGFVTSMFSRNMITVLSIALAGSHLIRFGTKISEGLENKDEENKDDKKDKKNKKGNKNKKTDEEDNDDDEEELLDGIEEKADRDKLKDLITNREKVNEDFSKMSGTADKIVNSLKELQPLITQTESFVEKYSDYAKLGENLKNKYA